MGLLDFVKNAGRKVFGDDDDNKPSAPPSGGVSAEELAKQRERRQAHILVQQVEAMKLEVSDFSVKVSGDTATIKGAAKSQAEREKIALLVGNTHGIARVDDQMTVKEGGTSASFYTVKSGDTLSKIAKEQYGNAGRYPAIFEANRPMLEDPDKIYPGQVLRIPAQEG